MAKRSKKTSSKSEPKAVEASETVEDAIVVSETAPEEASLDDTLAEEAKEVAETTPSDQPDEEVTEPTVEEPSEEPPVGDAAAEEPPVEEPPIEEIAPPPAPEPAVTVQKVGFMPLALGGLVAGGIGYGAAMLGAGGTSDLQAMVDQQASQIETLTAELAALPGSIDVPDVAPLQSAVEALQGETSALSSGQEAMAAEAASAVAATGEVLATLDERLTAVERAPGEDGAVTDTAIASFERELDELREELNSQESRMQEVADAATAEVSAAREAAAADLAAVRAEAEAQEAAARAEAQAALAAAAISEIRVAVESGAPFDEAAAKLADVGVEVPEALAAVAAEGVQTQQVLLSDFPDLAREALSVARDAGGDEEGSGGLGSFFRDQLGARSTVPREGDDPDAVLSRAEAAAQSGDLDAALAEISALPENVQTVFADWMAQSETRSAALTALSELDETVN